MAKSNKNYVIYQTINGSKEPILSFTIELEDPENYDSYEWDSKTGLVTAYNKNTQKRCIIPTSGTTFGQLQPEAFEAHNVLGMIYSYEYN